MIDSLKSRKGSILPICSFVIVASDRTLSSSRRRKMWYSCSAFHRLCNSSNVQPCAKHQNASLARAFLNLPNGITFHFHYFVFYSLILSCLTEPFRCMMNRPSAIGAPAWMSTASFQRHHIQRGSSRFSTMLFIHCGSSVIDLFSYPNKSLETLRASLDDICHMVVSVSPRCSKMLVLQSVIQIPLTLTWSPD